MFVVEDTCQRSKGPFYTAVMHRRSCVFLDLYLSYNLKERKGQHETSRQDGEEQWSLLLVLGDKVAGPYNFAALPI